MAVQSLMVTVSELWKVLERPKSTKTAWRQLEVGRASENRPEDPLQTERVCSQGQPSPATKKCGAGSFDFCHRSDVFRTRTQILLRPYDRMMIFFCAAKNRFLGFFGIFWAFLPQPHSEFRPNIGSRESRASGNTSMHLLLPASCKTPRPGIARSHRRLPHGPPRRDCHVEEASWAQKTWCLMIKLEYV